MSELAVLNSTQEVGVFDTMDAFKDAQRMMSALMASTMIPDVYKNNMPNLLVAKEMSHRIGKSILEVMQNMQPVKGNIGWKSEYVILCINRSGLFAEPLEFVFSEDRQSCYATATRTNGKVLRGTSVSMELAKAEGWLDRSGSKWKTMPEQMLMYRSATFFSRVFCPEVLAGVQTADEIIDIGQVDAPAVDLSAIKDLNKKVAPGQEDDGHAFEDLNDDGTTGAEYNNDNPTTEAAAPFKEDDDF